MTALKIQIQGTKVETTPADNTQELTIVETYIVGSGPRRELENRHSVEIDGNKVVEFVFSDDTVWLGDHETIEEVFPGTSEQLRSHRNTPDEYTIMIPTELYFEEQNRSGVFSKVALKLVKIFTKKVALSPMVKKLAGELEEKQLNNRSGLFRLTNEFEFKEPLFVPDGNYLLFLHGTASSTRGSFSELKGTATWNYIHQTFGDNVLGFEHETLTKSPLQNVLELVPQLPDKATITIVSHSRGGLVGEILNRFCFDEPTKRGFSEKEKNYLRKHKRTDDLNLIEEIENAILGKDVTINKFVRVACTASGTSLASKRLNIYFNVLFNVIGLATGQSTNPIYAAFKDLIVALIESKDDASVLPGLEVQNPRSPFNQMLNNANPEIVISTPLIIIAGDAKMSLKWRAIKVVLSNLFFWGDNDLVVDTRSMYNGAKRSANKVQYFFDQGVSVSHFNYFQNEKTQNAILLALKSPDNKLISGFSKLEVRTFTEAQIRNVNLSLPGGTVFHDLVSGKKPIVILLPGIMGSTLSVNNKLIWINFLGFIGGSLSRLQYSLHNNKNVNADGLVASSYRRLTEYLKKDYDVVTFPFDWRRRMADSASSFNRKIEQLMEYGQPIKLIGHSMGGVLIRDFIINHPDTWEKLNSSNNFKLIFLGSPLGGSFRIPYVLFGLDSIIKKLDFIDFNNTKELVAIFSQFPGILSLLPLTEDNGNDFAKKETWEKMRLAFGDDQWPIPDISELHEFAKYRSKILNTSNLDLSNATYIAGQSGKGSQTISGYQITQKDNKPILSFLATREGDESVTWDSGIPQIMLTQNTVYYSDVTHGELANDPKLFGAISDLLTSGSTIKLKRSRPTVRSLEKEFPAKEAFDFDLSPQGVEKTLLGLGSDSNFISGDVPISVSVSLGDLKYAMYPLLVGHFEKDGILYAEKATDYYLGGELSRRHRLGLYPGPIGTSELVTSQKSKGFQGAIVVGLGRQGLLTEHRLTSTIEQGACNYLAKLNSATDSQLQSIPKTNRVGITALIVGSHYGGISIENSVRAIIQAVQNANGKVSQIYNSAILIDTIEFGEIYKDRALACLKALSYIEKEETRSLNIITGGNKIKENIGWRQRLPLDDTTEWWTRINVRRYKDEELGGNKQRNHLRFAISTDAARIEERSLTTLNDTLIEMLEDLSKKDEWSPELAKSIFELMIPNDFKDQVKRQSNINWILDKYTAAFPWELLQDSTLNSRPLSVNAGMIRQLATGDFRININPVMERTALVVADPDLKNPAVQLPAAYNEGEKVAELLSVQGFEVNRLLREPASQVLANLFSKNYKIIHLAGHGVFSSDPNEPTGMLIGPNAILTPAYIDQMSNVPDLVFVNCCYLGQTDDTAEKYNRNSFRLAANIGTQLIEIGIKAVVVAGWAVNDDAALEFAERFYEYMFQGYNFGDAIQKARKVVFDNYGARNNTWGAYQCYGDPFYRLSNDLEKTKEVYDFSIPDEAEIELSNLLNEVERGGYDPEATLQTMDAIEHALTKAGIQSGLITELQAFLYSSINRYELAISKFEQLWKEEKASCSFAATEKYCNIQVKLHAAKVKKAGMSNTQTLQAASDAIKKAIGGLEGLNSFGETVKRMILLGSAHKRLAMISQGGDKIDAYKCAASYYRKAYEASRQENKYYPLTNWLFIENALVHAEARSWGKDTLPKLNKLKKGLDTALEQITLKENQDREYWDWIAEATILLCKRLLEDESITFDCIKEQYKSAWLMAGSEGQCQIEIERFEFLEDALAMGGEKSRELLDLVSCLKLSLQLLV